MILNINLCFDCTGIHTMRLLFDAKKRLKTKRCTGHALHGLPKVLFWKWDIEKVTKNNLDQHTYIHTHLYIYIYIYLFIYLFIYLYTGCPRRRGPNFGRVFLRSNYTDITQNIYIQSSMVTEILAREKCGHLLFLFTVARPWRHICHMHLTFYARILQ